MTLHWRGGSPKQSKDSRASGSRGRPNVMVKNTAGSEGTGSKAVGGLEGHNKAWVLDACSEVSTLATPPHWLGIH